MHQLVGSNHRHNLRKPTSEPYFPKNALNATSVAKIVQPKTFWNVVSLGLDTSPVRVIKITNAARPISTGAMPIRNPSHQGWCGIIGSTSQVPAQRCISISWLSHFAGLGRWNNKCTRVAVRQRIAANVAKLPELV